MKTLTDQWISRLPSSERLVYEAIGPEHAAELHGALEHPEVYRFIEGVSPVDLESVRQACERKAAGPPPHRQDERWLDILVRRTRDGRALGRIEATLLEGRAEVAYLLGPEHWGRGYACEALEWLHRLIAQEPEIDSFWATVHPENARSIALLRRCGYRETQSWPELTSYDPGDLVFTRSPERAP